MKKELRFPRRRFGTSPCAPFVSIIGGAKISGKIDVIESPASQGRHALSLIGGGHGLHFSQSARFWKSTENPCARMTRLNSQGDLFETRQRKKICQLPVDFRGQHDSVDFGNRKIGSALVAVPQDGIPAGSMESVDIGPKSIRVILLHHHQRENHCGVEYLGPMGIFEIEASAKGTFGVAEALVAATAKGAVTVIIGGEIPPPRLNRWDWKTRSRTFPRVVELSLEFLEGKVLPGVTALTDK